MTEELPPNETSRRAPVAVAAGAVAVVVLLVAAVLAFKAVRSDDEGRARLAGEPLSTSPPLDAFPTAETVGVPEDWTPAQTVHGDFTIDTPGVVVEDVRVHGRIRVHAPNVTLRRVEVISGGINNRGPDGCYAGMVVEDSTIRRGSEPTDEGAPAAISTGSYTARRVLVNGVPEGFRIGGEGRCEPVLIEDSYVRVVAPDICDDWHGDGLQGWRGNSVTVRNTVLVMVESDDCGGTAPFFYPDQGNVSAHVDGLIVEGGGYPFRLTTPGDVVGLGVVDGSWRFGPVLVECSLVTEWEAHVVTLDDDGQPVRQQELPCDASSSSDLVDATDASMSTDPSS